MSRSRAPLLIGLTAAGGIGYYLYQSGGNAQAAEKKFEADLHKASGAIKGQTATAKTDAEKYGRDAGAKIDSAIAKGNAEWEKTKEKTEAYAKEARADATQKIDAFDKKVEDGTAKAKGTVSSWFGGK